MSDKFLDLKRSAKVTFTKIKKYQYRVIGNSCKLDQIIVPKKRIKTSKFYFEVTMLGNFNYLFFRKRRM
jgi:hypothetical protein